MATQSPKALAMAQELHTALNAARRRGFNVKNPTLVTLNGVRLDFAALSGENRARPRQALQPALTLKV